MKIPATLPPEAVTAIRDTREQIGVDVSPLAVRMGTLSTGDYSVAGLESEVAIELKGSIEDLLACVGRDRERFDREIQRLLAYPVRALVFCTTWLEIEEGRWRGRVTSAQVESSIMSWSARGIPVHLVGNRDRAGRLIAKTLYLAARRRYRESRELLRNVLPEEAKAT